MTHARARDRQATHLYVNPRRAPAWFGLGLGLTLSAALAGQAQAQPASQGARIRVSNTHPPESAGGIPRSFETKEARAAAQTPAFPGQTRAAAVSTKTPLEVGVVAHGLRHPWSFEFLPDGRVIVAEKPGAIRIVSPTGTISPELEGTPAVVYGGDAGLLDLALDPAFSRNRLIYLTYVEPRPGGCGVALAKATLSKDATRIEAPMVILRVEPTIRGLAHFGARLLFDRQGMLLVSLSERFFSPFRDQAQALDSRLGKILRVAPSGAPAPGNPFANTEGALLEIWSYGHRDPEGLAFQPSTGELWATEQGPRGGDELNLIRPGKNYGWPRIAYGTEYDGRSTASVLTSTPGMEQPVYYWDQPMSPGGVSFYDADLIPEWKGCLFVASHGGRYLSRLVLEGRRVAGEERLLLDLQERLSDVKQGPDGALWVITDDRDGRLLRIAPRTP